MMPRLPKGGDKHTLYMSLALGTMCTLYLYVKFALPSIIRWIEIALP